jgi:hypothetical protein
MLWTGTERFDVHMVCKVCAVAKLNCQKVIVLMWHSTEQFPLEFTVSLLDCEQIREMGAHSQTMLTVTINTLTMGKLEY